MRTRRLRFVVLTAPALAVTLLVAGCASQTSATGASGTTAPSASSSTSPAGTAATPTTATTTPSGTAPDDARCTVTDPDALKHWGADRARRGVCAAITVATACFGKDIVLGVNSATGAPLKDNDLLGPVTPYIDTPMLTLYQANSGARDEFVYGPNSHYGLQVSNPKPPLVEVTGASLTTRSTGAPLTRLDVKLSVYATMTFDNGGDASLANFAGEHTLRRTYEMFMTESQTNESWLMTGSLVNVDQPKNTDESDVEIPASLQRK